MEFESRLVPILRESVEVIKMVLFKKLRDNLTEKLPERDASFRGRLAGAMVNELFGTPNDREPHASFMAENLELIDKQLSLLGQELPELSIPLTDALRTQTLCDYQEGEDTSRVLARAQELAILLPDRELPMPNSFVDLVRRMGKTFGLIIPPLPPETPTTSSQH